MTKSGEEPIKTVKFGTCKRGVAVSTAQTVGLVIHEVLFVCVIKEAAYTSRAEHTAFYSCNLNFGVVKDY